MLQYDISNSPLNRRENFVFRLFASFARFAFGMGMSAFGLFLAALAPFLAAAAALFLIARALGMPLLVP
jgi:ABC-type multidrug transport system permease subunit